mmetsp:Transcript_26593/g.64311  ORF Transcript_26593/g.64311 Transcript_26593/m.64311 type:complete len:235 (+) Transcript_26593:6627-7331(+)
MPVRAAHHRRPQRPGDSVRVRQEEGGHLLHRDPELLRRQDREGPPHLLAAAQRADDGRAGHDGPHQRRVQELPAVHAAAAPAGRHDGPALLRRQFPQGVQGPEVHPRPELEPGQAVDAPDGGRPRRGHGVRAVPLVHGEQGAAQRRAQLRHLRQLRAVHERRLPRDGPGHEPGLLPIQPHAPGERLRGLARAAAGDGGHAHRDLQGLRDAVGAPRVAVRRGGAERDQREDEGGR